MQGTVKWFDRKKGYGFIEGEDGKDYFVHHKGLAQGTFIRDNDLVNFKAAETDKGLQAQEVSLLQKGSERAGAADTKKPRAKAEPKDDDSEGASEEESESESESEDDFQE